MNRSLINFSLLDNLIFCGQNHIIEFIGFKLHGFTYAPNIYYIHLNISQKLVKFFIIINTRCTIIISYLMQESGKLIFIEILCLYIFFLLKNCVFISI